MSVSKQTSALRAPDGPARLAPRRQGRLVYPILRQAEGGLVLVWLKEVLALLLHQREARRGGGDGVRAGGHPLARRRSRRRRGPCPVGMLSVIGQVVGARMKD